MVAGTRTSRAAQATAWPWFPALAATTPARAASSSSAEILLNAPRILKEPVRWRFSALSQTRRPVSREKVSEEWTGVTRATPSSRSRARSKSGSRSAVRIANSEDLLHDLADCGQRVELTALDLVEEPSQL